MGVIVAGAFNKTDVHMVYHTLHFILDDVVLPFFLEKDRQNCASSLFSADRLCGKSKVFKVEVANYLKVLNNSSCVFDADC